MVDAARERRPVRRVAVVGGGIGGLTTALALHQAGFQVTVFERATALAEVGAALQVAPNAGRVLVHLGLGPALAACGAVSGITLFRHARTGHVLRRIDSVGAAARFGVPYYRVHRADLQAALAQALATRDPGTLRLGWNLSHIAPRPDGVGLSFANGREEQTDLLVAADGIRSIVRAALFPADAPPRFLGYAGWRAVIPTAALPARLREEGVSFGGGRFIIQYPIRRGEQLNIGAWARADHWVEEGWRIPGRAADLRAAFADYHDGVRDLLARVPESTLFRWGFFGRSPLPNWAPSLMSTCSSSQATTGKPSLEGPPTGSMGN